MSRAKLGPPLHVRVEDSVLVTLKAKAAAEDRSLSDIIRRVLRSYAEEPQTTPKKGGSK